MICKTKFLIHRQVKFVGYLSKFVYKIPSANHTPKNIKNFFLFPQQLFRSQNPATNAGIPGQPSGAPQLQQALSLSSQQYLAQQNAAYAAAQQPYVINPGQDVQSYMGLIPAGMPQYYGMAPSWSMCPANLIPQPNQQPRRPLTPSQQGAENPQYQVCLAVFF